MKINRPRNASAKSKLRVCCIVYAESHGRGGHIHSAKTIHEYMCQVSESWIVNAGPVKCPPLLDAANYLYLGADKFLKRSIQSIVKLIRKHSLTHLIAFDPYSWFIARIASAKARIPAVHVKCGGPAFSGYFPHSTNLLVYQESDLSYYGNKKNTKKYRIDNIFLNTNRISVPMRRPPILSDIDPLSIIRISRIGPTYESSILLGNELVHLLKSMGRESEYTVLGTIESGAAYKRIQQQLPRAIFKTGDRYTLNAYEYLSAHDIAVAVGRGVPEALLNGLPTFTTCNNSTSLIYINSKNYNVLLKDNFSGRTHVSVDQVESSKNIFRLYLKDAELLRKSTKELQNKAYHDFHVESARNNLVPFLLSSNNVSNKFPDIAIHYASCLKKGLF